MSSFLKQYCVVNSNLAKELCLPNTNEFTLEVYYTYKDNSRFAEPDEIDFDDCFIILNSSQVMLVSEHDLEFYGFNLDEIEADCFEHHEEEKKRYIDIPYEKNPWRI